MMIDEVTHSYLSQSTQRTKINWNTWEIKGWHKEACVAACWREGPEPANNIEMELSSFKHFAASTELIDDELMEPPSCSANTSVLIYFIK